MAVVIHLVIFLLIEIILAIHNGIKFCRNAGIKTSSGKNDLRFAACFTTSLTLPNLSGLQGTFLAVCLAAAILPVLDASAAEVFTKAQALEGTVAGVTAEGVEFETIYGKGAILIQWSDIEMIRSAKEFLVLYGEAEEAIGRIWGYENGELMVGQNRATASRIPVGQIYRSLTRDQYEKSRLDWLRARYRYWTANYDLAFAVTDATTDTTSFYTALELRRKKKPTDFFFGTYYFFGSAKKSGESRTPLKTVCSAAPV